MRTATRKCSQATAHAHGAEGINLALRAGVDIDMLGTAYMLGLPTALKRGDVTIGMVDEAVFVWVVHDVWPNAISGKVKGYVHPKSWYVDFSPVTVG